MTRIRNPFVIGAYISPEYFCDREEETATLLKHIDNGRNVALTAPRRLGKTGLIHHFLQSDYIQEGYYTFFVDLYPTNSLAEMVHTLAKAICTQLQSRVVRWWERFGTVVSSLSMGISIDPMTGQPSFNVSLGQIHSPEHTLDEIFRYLESADKPCVVAIDEFQQIANYEEKNVEALLRTRIQCGANTHFIFSGSKRHMMAQMFNSPSHPFYQSAIGMSLNPLPLDVYCRFCQDLFEKNGKCLDAEVVAQVYNDYEGYTWFMHMMLNDLFANTAKGGHCSLALLPEALQNVVLSQEPLYREQMALIPMKQKMLLQAIAKEGRVQGITSSAFIRKHSLPGASSVQAALKGLLEKEIVTQSEGTYWIYDYFFAHWLKDNT